MDSKINIWLTLAKEKYPKLNEGQLTAMCMHAASDWWNGTESELANLFDQYVMLKNLKGFENGETN